MGERKTYPMYTTFPYHIYEAKIVREYPYYRHEMGRDKRYWFVHGQEGTPDPNKPSMWIDHTYPRGYGMGASSSGMTKEMMFHGLPPDPAGFSPYGDAPNAWKPKST